VHWFVSTTNLTSVADVRPERVRRGNLSRGGRDGCAGVVVRQRLGQVPLDVDDRATGGASVPLAEAVTAGH
jgi:hypothetical protein